MVLACGIGWLFYLLNLKTPASNLDANVSAALPPISVIICAHNEAKNLQQHLPAVIKQNYPAFEVIVVNDDSTDNTAETLASLQQKFPLLRVLFVKAEEKKLPGKKWLLQYAMQHARHDVVALTDADCFPAGDEWLKHMATKVLSGGRVVLGYSPYEKGRGTRDDGRTFSILNTQYSILSLLQRFESTQTAWQYFSNAMSGKAYMGVGRNMMLHKNDYLKWFETSTHEIAGGDDDLFVNWMMNNNDKHTPTSRNKFGTGPLKRGTTAICVHEAAFVYTKPKATYWSWLQQKTRHAQASYHYAAWDKTKLFAFALAQFGLYAGAFALLFFGKGGFVTALLVLLCWSMMQVMLSRSAYKALRQQDLLLWIPLLQPLYVFSISLIFLLTFIKRSNTWN